MRAITLINSVRRNLTFQHYSKWKVRKNEYDLEKPGLLYHATTRPTDIHTRVSSKTCKHSCNLPLSSDSKSVLLQHEGHVLHRVSACGCTRHMAQSCCQARHSHTRYTVRFFHDSHSSKFRGTSDASKDGQPVKSAHELYERLAGSVTSLEKATKIYGYSSFKIAGAVVVITGVGVFLFREVIRENVAGEVSTVATKTLNDESLQQKTQEITINLLHTIFRSPQIQQEAVRFLEGILGYQETETALISLLLKVIRRPDTQSQLAHLVKDVVNQSLRDEAFRTQLAQNLKLLLSDDNTKQALLEILFFVLNDEDILEATKDFLQQILASSRVQHEASKLGKRALDDIVGDPNTQKHTGDALWNAFQYSITPAPSRWFQRKETQPSPPESDGDAINIHVEKKLCDKVDPSVVNKEIESKDKIPDSSSRDTKPGNKQETTNSSESVIHVDKTKPENELNSDS